MADANKTGKWAEKWKEEFEQLRQKYLLYFKKNNTTIILVSDERKEEDYE